MSERAYKLNILCRIAVFAVMVLLIITSIAPAVYAAPQYSGKFGKMKWSLEGGVLTVEGSKAMPDFSEQEPAPWYEHREEIRHINIDDRITSIGALSFYDCSAVTAVELSKNVKKIGEMAFAGCTSLTTITLLAVEQIGDYAFSRCFSLANVVLPATVKTLGKAAFYRCESLKYMRIPTSVSNMGASVFAYCRSLISVEIDAPFEILPEWTFYGCESLNVVWLPETMNSAGENAFGRCDVLVSVYYNGTEEDEETLIGDIVTGSPDVEIRDLTSDNEVETVPPATKKEFEQNGDKVTETTTEITGDKDFVIETKVEVTYPLDTQNQTDNEKESAKIEINATVNADDGWNALISEIEKQTTKQGVFKIETDNKVPLEVNATLLHGSVILGKTLESFAGKDIVLKLCTPNGSRWSIDCLRLKGYKFKKSYDLEYKLTLYKKVSQKHAEVLGTAVSYWLKFADKINFPVTVELYIDSTASRQTATIFENVFSDGLQKLQSVMVDADGTACFKMGNINKGKRYVTALNVSGVTADEVILPQTQFGGEDWLDDYVPVTEQYTITEVRGFMGMTMKQFTTVLLCSLVGLAFVVFVVILIINLLGKKRITPQN